MGVPVCDPEDLYCADQEDVLATTPTPDPDAFVCPSEFGWFEDPENCIKYYRCDMFIADRRTCEECKCTSFGLEKFQPA